MKLCGNTECYYSDKNCRYCGTGECPDFIPYDDRQSGAVEDGDGSNPLVRGPKATDTKDEEQGAIAPLGSRRLPNVTGEPRRQP